MNPNRRIRGVLAGALLAAAVALPAHAQPSDPFTGSSGLGDPYYPDDGNGGYQVGHYAVAIAYDPPSRHLTGHTRLDAVAVQPLRRFDLDYAGPPALSATVNNLPAGLDRHGPHKLGVTPAVPLLPGLPFTVTVDYAGTEGDDPGAGWTISPSGGAFAAGEPHSARTWYPLNDTLSDKATFEVRVTVPQQWQVVSNGLKVGDTVDGADRTVAWASRHPTLGYLTTVAIDRFEYLEQRGSGGEPLISAFAPKARGLRSLESRLPEILDFLENLYGPYPFESGGGIYVDSPLDFSLETQTRPIYAPWVDLDTVVHENTHQWWGDSMSVRNWSDICLNECFASYTADYLWPERKEGRDVDAKYRKTVADHRGDRLFWDVPLQNSGAGKEFSSVYRRGPLFLHALRHLVGDQVFFPAIARFVRGHAYGSASMPEFRRYMQSMTPTDLSGFFTAWLEGTEPPPDRYLYPGTLRG